MSKVIVRENKRSCLESKLLKNYSDKIHQGGGVAAPIGSQVLGEVLPYLEVKKDNQTEEDIKKEVAVPNVVGMTVAEAEKVLKEMGLKLDLNIKDEINKKETIIKEQIPKYGIKVYEGTKISVTI